MSDTTTMTALDVARRAAGAGGAIEASVFGTGMEIRRKAVSDLVSDADIDSERAIVDSIRQACPDHAILAEEGHGGDPDAEHLWVVDPLDGTTNFAHGIDHIAVSVAYYHRGVAQCGVVHNPIRGDWFTAARGQGAWHNDEPARVSTHRRLDEVLVGVGFYYDRGAMMRATLAAVADLFRQQIHGIRRFGTASLDLCLVGVGVFGAFFEYELSPWDFAAGRLFAEEAGGRVTTCRGAPLPLGRTTVLASNGLLHEAMRVVVEPHVPAQ